MKSPGKPRNIDKKGRKGIGSNEERSARDEENRDCEG
jgi:hypothetical protein